MLNARIGNLKELMEIAFTKFHGAGNDFIIIDNRDLAFVADKETVAELCDRHFGIGADGLMLLENHPTLDFSMRYFNSDGGEATLCGNGGRCIVAFAYILGIIQKTTEFMAVDGIHFASIEASENAFNVDLKMLDLGLSQINSEFDFLNTGSPHHISWVSAVNKVDVLEVGRKIRYSEKYKEIGGVNVNFIEPISDNKLKIRTYERGVENETLACGTGSTAAAILYAAKTGLKSNTIYIEALGGDLQVKFEIEGQFAKNILLSGPAKKVFSGIIIL